MNENLGGLVSGLQKQAEAAAASVKEKLEAVVGEENVAKVVDVLNTDVGAIAQDSVERATDALENLTHKDLDGDGDIGGKPQAAEAIDPPPAADSPQA